MQLYLLSVNHPVPKGLRGTQGKNKLVQVRLEWFQPFNPISVQTGTDWYRLVQKLTYEKRVEFDTVIMIRVLLTTFRYF